MKIKQKGTLMPDTPIVAYENNIINAVLTKGIPKSEVSSVFSDDNSDAFIVKSDASGSIDISLKVSQLNSTALILGEHRYDESGFTKNYDFNLSAHDGTSFVNISSGSFIENKNSMFNSLAPHALGVTSVTSKINASGIKKVVWSGTSFYGISDVAIFKSQDGSVWNVVAGNLTGNAVYNDIKAYDTELLICGNSGLFAHFDGNAWNIKPNISTSNFNCVAGNFSTFLVAGDNNEIWRTGDLITFTQISSPSTPIVSFTHLNAVGFGYNIVGGSKSYSSLDDGVTFSLLFDGPVVSTVIKDVKVYNDSELYIVGSRGTVLQSFDLVTYNDVSLGNASVINTISITATEMLTFDQGGLVHISKDFGSSWAVYPVSVNALNLNSATNGIDYVINNLIDIESMFVSNRYKLSISNITPSTDFNIPNIYIGTYFEIGKFNYGFDSLNTNSGVKSFNSESGRILESTLWNRLELTISISVVDNLFSVNLNNFRSSIYNKRRAFWFSFKKDSDPYSTYLMKIKGKVSLKLNSPVHSSSNFSLVEFV